MVKQLQYLHRPPSPLAPAGPATHTPTRGWRARSRLYSVADDTRLAVRARRRRRRRTEERWGISALVAGSRVPPPLPRGRTGLWRRRRRRSDGPARAPLTRGEGPVSRRLAGFCGPARRGSPAARG